MHIWCKKGEGESALFMLSGKYGEIWLVRSVKQ